MLKARSTKMPEDCDEESGPSGRTIEETDAEEEVVPDDSAQNQVESTRCMTEENKRYRLSQAFPIPLVHRRQTEIRTHASQGEVAAGRMSLHASAM